MKSDKEIKEMIQMCMDLKAVMPQHNFFGGDNWKGLDKSILVLGNCIGKDEYELKDSLETILDTMAGDEACDSPVVQAYD